MFRLSRTWRKFFGILALATVIGGVIGMLIGGAVTLTAGQHQNSVAVGLLIGLAIGLGFGILPASMIASDF